MYKTWCRFIHRAPLDLVYSGNGSIGIDLTLEKDRLKTYFRILENEFIKVGKSWNFDDFRPKIDPLPPLRHSISITMFISYNF